MITKNIKVVFKFQMMVKKFNTDFLNQNESENRNVWKPVFKIKMDTEKMKNQKFVISVSSSAEHIVSKYYNIFGNFILYILFYHNAPGTALSRCLYRFLHYIIYVYGYIYI